MSTDDSYSQRKEVMITVLQPSNPLICSWCEFQWQLAREEPTYFCNHMVTTEVTEAPAVLHKGKKEKLPHTALCWN